MSATTISIGSTGISIASILNPNFRGVVDAGTIVKYLLNAISIIKRYDLPIRIYLTKDVSERIGNILASMGIRFRLTHIDKMVPPYIYIYNDDQYYIIKTIDENGKNVAEFSVLSNKFIEELHALITKKKKDTKLEEEVEELIIHLDSSTHAKKNEKERINKKRGVNQ
ncbi:MAG: hypothetical protein QXL19_08880 [Ignisphaera sp.]